MRRGVSLWPSALLLVALLGLWEIYVDAGGAASDVLPPPHAIASAMWTDRGLIWDNFRPTAAAIVVGLLVACVLGLALATAMHLIPWARRAVYPLLIASQNIPIPLLAPLLVFWLGFGFKPELVVIALVSFFAIVLTTLTGLATVDRDLVQLTRSFDAPRLSIFRHVEFPAALPGVFTGARIAVVWTGVAAVLAEQSNGSTTGLGYLFETAQAQFLMARAWATIAVVCIFTIALFALLSLAEQLTLPWAYQPIGELS